MSDEKVCCQKGECAILKGFEDKIAELESKFKESEKNTDDWTIKVDKKYKELEQKIETQKEINDVHLIRISKLEDEGDNRQSGNTAVHMENMERLEKLELAIKNSPPNSHLKQEISELTGRIVDISELSRRVDLVLGVQKQIDNIKSVLKLLIQHYDENLEYITSQSLMWDFNREDLEQYIKQLDGSEVEKPSRVYMWVCPECEEDTYFPIKCDKCTSHHLDSKPSREIKVTVSRNDGEKGENSEGVISSKENNLSAPERRKKPSEPSEFWNPFELTRLLISEFLDDLKEMLHLNEYGKLDGYYINSEIEKWQKRRDEK